MAIAAIRRCRLSIVHLLLAGNDRIIPISTPFMLTAAANDSDGHPIAYCWEQWDNEVGAMAPQSTNAVGPIFPLV